MEPSNVLPIPVGSGTEGDVPTSNEGLFSIEGHQDITGSPSPHQSSDNGAQSATDTATSGHLRREDDVALLARLVADAIKESVAELRKDEETRISQLTTAIREEVSALRGDEEARTSRLEWAIKGWKPDSIGTDPTTNFWTAYKRVADESDNDLTSGYLRDLDTTLLFAGLFSAVTSAFIIQIIPELQPDPTDLTNVLLLRILQQNTSFGGINPLTPVSSISTDILRAQTILFVCLSVTLLVAFIAVLGKQWIMYYTRPTTWNIVDRGKERQAKFVGLQKWRLRLVIDSLSVMLQFALLLFGVALTIYLWELDVPTAEVALAVTSIGFAFYTCITLLATTFKDCPFQTPLSFLLPNVLPWMKVSAALARVWLRQKVTSPPLRIGWVLRTFASGTNPPYHTEEEALTGAYPVAFSDPALWRSNPLFTSPIPKDTTASAGFWMLENATDSSAVSAVAAVFSELQWQSHDHSTTTALVRLRDAYAECLRVPELKESARLQALELAAAYYVLYRNQLFRSGSVSSGVDVWRLPSDLLQLHIEKWDGDDVFEHLLRIGERSKSVTSPLFLSYIAPYWICGDSEGAVKFRPKRLRTVNKLFGVLEETRTLNPRTLTDCLLCVGLAIDLPLHPDDLIRIDKRLVVEHIRDMAFFLDRRDHAQCASEIVTTLTKNTPHPFVDPKWINELLKSASMQDMNDDTFISFLELSARRNEELSDQVYIQAGETDLQSPVGTVSPEIVTPESLLFIKILQNIRACSAYKGWKNEAIYGGLIAMKDIPQLGSLFLDKNSLGTLFKLLEEDRPFRVREAAYDVILVAREGWLRLPDLRSAFEERDFPRELHNVVINTGRSDHQSSFLTMMEVLSEDRYWHSYLRKAMEIWLPFRYEGPDQAIRIFTRVSELPQSEYDGSPLDKFLEQLVENEWAAVPGRPLADLTADRLEPLVEITKQFKKLLFTEIDREAVLVAVGRVIPGLKKRHDDGYEGPGEDIRDMVGGLIGILQEPTQSISRR